MDKAVAGFLRFEVGIVQWRRFVYRDNESNNYDEIETHLFSLYPQELPWRISRGCSCSAERRRVWAGAVDLQEPGYAPRRTTGS